ncbi:alpha/beta fold hydrolase [Streptomyces sp. NBC_00103]|uniref:alpha/beta fold hydrolase n=1 Tax=Streptomyces sp. NBC_00103 TaxID=2975653 RepID=UPI0022554A2D|nr:alpha/beta hydrolase [Streptomyces sp. NBC_00103]MCX5373723.1 alpha/beta hydrolase [Streptomyces sp. NBC_00103]
MVPEVPSRRLVLGGMLAAGAATLGSGTPASATGARPTVVLVHGVFADASGWSAVTASLLDAGYQVIAPANPLRDLAGDSAYVSGVLGTITGPVILVGHSYGGEVITNAGAGHDHVRALVYAAAFAPDAGESALQLAGRFPGSRLESALVGRPYPIPGAEPGLDGYIDPAKFHDVFAQDLPRSTTRVMATAQRPGSIGGLAGPSGVPAWRTVPSWYVVAGADRVIPPAAQRFMAKRAGSRTVEVGGASHVVMMSHPQAVVRQIRAADRATR